MNRREFLMTGAGAVAAGCATADGGKSCSGCRAPKPRILFGACRPLSDTPLMKSVGYDFVENSFGAMFLPDKARRSGSARRRRSCPPHCRSGAATDSFPASSA